MNDWKVKYHPKGTRVRVLDLDKQAIGDGELAADYKGSSLIETWEDLVANIPVIKLDSGTTIRGDECWWIPLSEIEHLL